MQTITEDDFAVEAQAFLEANAEPRQTERRVFGEGPDEVGLLPERSQKDELEEVTAAKAWARKVFDAGFGWITGPTHLRGAGSPGLLPAALLLDRAGLRDGPTRLVAASVSAWWHRPSLRTPPRQPKSATCGPCGEAIIIACQLFSEPAAGSRPCRRSRRAPIRDGDEWIVNGQKVWTSGAQYSDIGEIICRTDPEPAQAQGPHGLHRRHARTRRRGAAAAPDDRRRVVQRGLLHRRPRSRRPSSRRRERRLVGGAHDAHERACQHRRRRRRGRARSRLVAPPHRPRQAPRAQRGPARASEDCRRLDQRAGRQVHQRTGARKDPSRRAPRARSSRSPSSPLPRTCVGSPTCRRRSSANASSSTPANGAPTPGARSSLAFRECASPVGPTR